MERRKACSTDAEIIAGWFPTRADVILWGGPTVPDPLTPAWLAHQFETLNYWVWIDSIGEIQGVFALYFREDQSIRFGRFALSPHLRGQHLAKELVRDVISLARSLGAKKVSLAVYGSNRKAKHIYEGVGFEVFERRIAQEDASGVTYLMKLDL